MLNYGELDWKLIGAALALSAIGILLILSAQYHADSDYRQAFYLRQLIWLVVALTVFAAVVHVPLRLFDLGAYLLFGIALVLLLVVLAVGSSKLGGARRFLTLGPLNLAPSDIAKVTLVLALSRFLAYSKLAVTSKRRLAMSVILTVIPVGLILKQPDLGTSLVFFVILFVLWKPFD